MNIERTLRRRVLAGEDLRGALVRVPSEEIVEIVASNGLDFILLDCEHGPRDEAEIRRHIAAAAIFGVETIVRIGENDNSLILRVLDAGASGIVIPHLESRESTAEIAAMAKYPPSGTRGFAVYSRAGKYGNVVPSEYQVAANDYTLVVGMIESPAAAGRAEEILSDNHIDAYMIGVSDLGASTTPVDPPKEDSISMTHDGARAAGKARFDIVNDAQGAKAARDSGATVIVYNFSALLGGLLRDLP